MVGVSEVKSLVRRLNEVMDALNIPDKLEDVGASPDEVNDIVSDVMSYKRNIANNPAPIDPSAIKEILKKAFEGRSKR